jgi:nucleotide-binding universal stress UspA family protein
MRAHGNLIVCAIDGSDQSLAAASVAQDLARGLGGRLVCAHVIDIRDGSVHNPRNLSPVREIPLREAQARMDSLLARRGIRGQLEVHVGDPTRVLLAIANRRDITLMVTGSRGLGTIKGALVGSVSVRLMRESRCPVVVVSETAAARRVESADSSASAEAPAFVCGLPHEEHESVLLFAIDLARRFGARLVLTHVDPPPVAPAAGMPFDLDALAEDSARSRLRLLDRCAAAIAVDEGVPRVQAHLGRGDPGAVLRTVATAESAQLLIVGSRGRGPIRAAVMGSVSGGLAASAPCPVAVLPNHAAVGPGTGLSWVAARAPSERAPLQTPPQLSRGDGPTRLSG